MSIKAFGRGFAVAVYAVIGGLLGFTLTYLLTRLSLAIVGDFGPVQMAARWAPLAGTVLIGLGAALGYLKTEHTKASDSHRSAAGNRRSL